MKRKPKITLESYGRYSRWDKSSRSLPKILEFTNSIKAVEGNEFGLVLKIEGGKGIKLNYVIKHPSFENKAGIPEADFTGEYYVNSNLHEFYIGDCIWSPVDDKVGVWEITVYHNKLRIACQIFEVILPES